MCVELERPKFQLSSAKGAFSNSGLNGWGMEKMCVFQRKTGHGSETVRE